MLQLFQSLEGFMVDGNLYCLRWYTRVKTFQSLEGFMVDGNSSGSLAQRWDGSFNP